MIKKLIFISIIALISSCAKEQDCSDGGLNIGFTTFDPNENDTVRIRNFEKGDGFSTALSEIVYVFLTIEDEMNGITNGSTIVLRGNSENFHPDDANNQGFLSSYYDYEVEFRTNVYRISKMGVLKKSKKCGGLLSLDCPTCYSPVTSFDLNNSPKVLDGNEIYFLE